MLTFRVTTNVILVHRLQEVVDFFLDFFQEQYKEIVRQMAMAEAVSTVAGRQQIVKHIDRAIQNVRHYAIVDDNAAASISLLLMLFI